MQINFHRTQPIDSRYLPELHTSSTVDSHYGSSTPDFSRRVYRSTKGRGPSRLLALPSESLAQITSYLNPASLFALSRTCKLLNEHINDDATWHKAFSWNFFGDHEKLTYLFRRTEDTWKGEFVSRFNILTRWERSRGGIISHIPHHSAVNGMHLFGDRSYGPALLSISLQYGIVARSLPLSGKVYKGFLSAVHDGIGIGNPNAEFSPDASACSLFVDGWATKILWGFSTGDVSVTSCDRIMDPVQRSAAKIMRCSTADEHMGRVIDATWDLEGTAFVTVAMDGIAKVWEYPRMKCTWILRSQDTPNPDACIQIVSDLRRGLILMTKASGTVVVWKLDQVFASSTFQQPGSATAALIVPPPCGSGKIPIRLFVDPKGTGNIVSYGICFSEDTAFYRVDLDLFLKKWEYTRFINGPLGFLRLIYPCFREAENDVSIIITGDDLGNVCFFEWSETAPASADRDNILLVSPFAQLNAFDDGAVTAIACNSHILAVGSSRGLTKVWDFVSLHHIRSFSSPLPRRNGDIAVSQILLDKDMIVCSAGSVVLAWKTGVIKANKRRRIRTAPKVRNEKWYERFEMSQEIAESHHALKTIHDREQRHHERLRTQLKLLDTLGLDEAEALDYAIMLSQDEEEERKRRQADFELSNGLISVSSSSGSSVFSTEQSTSDAAMVTTERVASLYPSNHLISLPKAEPMDARHASSSSSSVDENNAHRDDIAEDDGVNESGDFPPATALEDSGRFLEISPTSSSSSSFGSYGVMSKSWPKSTASPRMVNSAGGPSMSSLDSRTDGNKGQSGFPNVGFQSVRGPLKYAEIVQSGASTSGVMHDRRLNARELDQDETVSLCAAHAHHAPSLNDDRYADMDDADLQFAIELSLVEALSQQQI